VLSILYLYEDCKLLHFSKSGTSIEPVQDYHEFQEEVTEYFSALADGTYTFFSLIGAGSPFSERLYLVYGGEGATTDYYQFAVVIKGAEAMTPR